MIIPERYLVMEVPIRVVARVKPCLPEEENERCLQVAPIASQIILGFDNFCDFDAVFGEDVSQKELYNTCLSDMVTSFFQGFNTTVLTYGQQGSGKTYTMTGPDLLCAMNEEEFGVLPQAVRHIFKMMNEIPEREYRVHISYLIINRETVYDLLASGHPLSPLNVLEDNVGNVVIPGLTVVDCNNISEVLNCLEAGLLQKHSATTQGFDMSSAHTLFNLTLEHQWSEADGRMKYLYSRISFVDLAGMEERLGMNYNEMVGVSNSLKNNCFLNSDLKILANVLQCLINKSYRGLIPYRDSRLTHILKDSFGGNGITVMICCLSPLNKDYDASFSTLKLGSLTRYAVNYPTLNLVLQNSMQSLTSPRLQSSLTNVWSSRQSGNLSSTPISQGTTIKSINNAQQQQPQQPPIQPQPQPHSFVYPFPNYQLYQPTLNGINPNFGSVEDLPLHENDEIFKVQFAASQWHLLVSSAEDLLADILQSGSISPSDKSKIQSWLCMKAEADECIGTDVPPLQTETEGSRPLEVIEELSEPNDIMNDTVLSEKTDSEISSSVASLGEEFYNRLEVLRQKFFTLTSDLIKEAEIRYHSCEKLIETESRRNSVDKTKAESEGPCATSEKEEGMSLSEASSALSVTDCDRTLKERNELDQDGDVKCSEEANHIKIEQEGIANHLADEDFNYESDKENLVTNFGSRLSLISKTSSASSNGAKKIKKKKLRSRKMVDTFKRMSSIGRSGRRDSKTVQKACIGLVDDSCSSSAADINAFSREVEESVDGEEEEGLGASSERELLKRVSSKFVSVSKGSSRCVSNLRSKSCQLKRSIRSHIFKKRNKTNQVASENVEIARRSHSPVLPCSVRRVSDELKVASERLLELKATIKEKEAFIHELKLGGTEAETTRRKCEFQMKTLEEELDQVSRMHHRAQDKMMEAAENVEEKLHYKNKIYDYSRKMNDLKKEIANLKKLASISRPSGSEVKELEESVRKLREEQEELHTKLREELQRKKQLEQQILREERCARNPLCSSSKLLDEEDSDKEMESEPVEKQPTASSFIRPENDVAGKQRFMSKRKKRKLASSAGDSQSENSLRGDSRLGFKDNMKSVPLDRSYSESAVRERDSNNPDFIRKEIGLLRTARDNLVAKRQKIDKRIRKGRMKGDGCEAERMLLEYDEAVEGLDSVIERKNEVLTGKANQIQPFAPLLAKNDLEERLKSLPIAELHFLLVKFFTRIIDLRIEFRKHELAFAELENQYDEQNRYISNLKAAYQQASLEMERRLTSLQREYQYKISYLLRQFNEDTTGHGVHEMKLMEMEQQLYYYKKLSRELKDKLREYLNQGSSRPQKEIESIPGPSGIKPIRHDYDPMSTFYPRVSDPSPPVTPQVWPRRGRRFALHTVAGLNTTKVTRQKNKLIIQQKGESKQS